MSKEKVGILQMIVCAAMWSMAGVMFKFIPWNPMVIAALRAGIASVVIYSYIRIRGMRVIISKKTVSAGLALACTCTLFVFANKLTTAANAIVLQYTAPVFLMLFSSVFYGQHFRRADQIAVGVTLAGISLFFFDQLAGGHGLGNILALTSGASMGTMYLLMGVVNDEERFSSILIGQLFSVVAGIPFFFFTEVELSFLPVLFIFLLGAFQLGVPYVLYALAAGKCPALACSLLAAAEPLLNPVWVMIFYGEVPGVFALIGGIIVIGSISVWSIWSDRHKETV